MAETIRYDTSEDPVAAQSIAEKEAESLKIGEELMAKQEKMLAGKYKSPEELESAYLELQKKLGQSESTTEKDAARMGEKFNGKNVWFLRMKVKLNTNITKLILEKIND